MKRNILMYFASFMILAVSFLLFIFAFLNPSRMSYYIYSGAALVTFCVINKVTEKRIRCNDGYNLLQAYFFYLKCEKNGINVRATKLKDEEMKTVCRVASDYDYCQNLTDAQLKELYRLGREISVDLNQKKGRKH